jgi:2-polyprenyl-3-methyl-5-hydroxy-6-metoxy-1,4-benzoquinol methylase
MTEATHHSNVDPDEIAKFERLAARWWDPTSEFRPLHEINPLRLEWINARASLASKTVVDVGCGGGILAEAMAARGARVTGIDLGEAPLAVARLHLKESGQRGKAHCRAPMSTANCAECFPLHLNFVNGRGTESLTFIPLDQLQSGTRL